MICPYCSGVVGIDCFNVLDCGMITQDMENMQQQFDQIEMFKSLLTKKDQEHKAELDEKNREIGQLRRYLYPKRYNQ